MVDRYERIEPVAISFQGIQVGGRDQFCACHCIIDATDRAPTCKSWDEGGKLKVAGGSFVLNYIQNTPFFLAHLAIGVIAVFALWRLSRLKPQLALALVASRNGDANLVNRGVALSAVEAYQGFFDLISSAFIFVGLVGTIYGFATGIPKLDNPSYRFEELARALSTSAFGIIWSLLYSGVISLYYSFSISPLLTSLRIELADQSNAKLIQELRSFTNIWSPEVTQTFARLALATDVMGAATQSLADSSRSSGESFRNIAQQVGGTVDRVEQLLKRTETLPAELTQELKVMFDALRKRIGGAGDKLAGELDRLSVFPGIVQSGIQEVCSQQLKLVDLAASAFVERSREIQLSFSASTDEVTTKFAKAVEQAVELPERTRERSEILSETYRLALEAEHKAMLGEIQRIGTTVLREHIQTLKQSAADLAQTSVNFQEKRSELFSSEREAVRGAISLCFADIRNFIERYRETFRSAEAELPAELTALHRQLIEQSTETAKTLDRAARNFGPEAKAATDAMDLVAGAVIQLTTAARAFDGPARPPAPEIVDGHKNGSTEVAASIRELLEFLRSEKRDNESRPKHPGFWSRFSGQ
jgi:hypothetical protein